ncbi:MAG: PEP-CTERM sorting domain-containing protein [Phycisphaerales bacterium]
MSRVLAVAAPFATASACAGSVINGGFEDPGLGFRTVLAGETYGSWTNAGPSDIEFVHATPNGAFPGLEVSAYEGAYWIDLVGVGSPSGIFQDIAGLEAGSLYQIDWAQAGNPYGPNADFTMSITWNGQVVATNTQTHGGNNGANMNWQTYSVTVTALDGANRLGFVAITGGNARGPALDAVGLALVPAPGSVALLGAGALFAARRRR